MGYILTEDGGRLLTEDGGHFLVEAAAPSFPQVPLDLRCELNLAGTWTNISTYAYQRDGSQPPVAITRGRPDESSTANPATCAWTLNNRDGRFSPKNPLSPYYGSLIRNTPVRWSVPAASSYLRLEGDAFDRAYVNDDTNIDITGSIEMRWAGRLTDWQGGALACKWDGGGCWFWALNSDGSLTFAWWDGASQWNAHSTVPVPYTSGDFALRVTMNAATGTTTFYTASGSSVDPGSWTQLGGTLSPTGGASTSIAVNHASALAVGYIFSFAPGQILGRVYEYRLYNGIAGTVAADGIFSGLAPGTVTWTDGQGNTWNLAGGAAVDNRDYRFHGEVSSLPPRWDVTGTDHYVPAQAGGPLRRLSQGSNNAMSAMKRAISLLSGSFAPIAYWPCEDAQGATQFGAAIGPYPMAFTQSPSPTLASDSTFTASAPLPSFNGSRFQGAVQPYTPTGTWVARFLLKLANPSANAVLLRVVSSPDAACPVVYVLVDTAGNLALEGFAPNGSVAFNTGFFSFLASGNPVMASVEAQQSGGITTYSLVTIAPGAGTGFVLNATVSGNAGAVMLVQPDVTGAFASTVFGHCYVQTAWESLGALGQPLNAWTGELAANRYARLCGENGYASRILGSPAYSAPMGPQGQATLDALLKECEQADQGQQYEPRQQLALGYRTLASMCNQAPAMVLDYTASEPGGVSGGADSSGLDPTWDDQLTANDWTVTRGAASGSQGGTWQSTLNDGSAMSISAPPAGAGDYAKTQTANVEYDSQLPDAAGWRVHLGSVDDERWPSVPVNLARTAMAPLQAAAQALEIGDYVEITDLPNVIVHDPVKQLALGMKESLGGFHWTMEYNCVPEQPYETVILDDPVYGRADTSGSSLHASATAVATTLLVDTAFGDAVWTTAAGDFPFDVAVAGERVTVTNISGAAALPTWTPVGSLLQGSATTFTIVPVTAGDLILMQVIQSSNSTVLASSLASSGVTWTRIATRQGVNTTGTAALFAGTVVTPGSQVVTVSWSGTAPATIREAGREFLASTGAWTVDATGFVDSAGTSSWAVLSPTQPGDLYWGFCLDSGTVINGNTGGFVYGTDSHGNGEAYNPGLGNSATAAAWGDTQQVLGLMVLMKQAWASYQTFTCTRAVNGVSKAQAAGADVRLWTPPVLALA